MSLFDYPRIHFKGTIQLNPGTANNDDYAQQPGAALLPASYGPYAGQVLGLIESKTVQARTYGMSDADFIAWVQKAHTFDVAGSPGQDQQIIPAEWNYYGGMESKILEATVIGVQTGPGQVYSAVSPDVPATAVIGADVSYSGHITDVNSEGSPPATQFFIDSLTLQNGTDDIPERNGVQGRLSVAEFLSERQSHGGRRSRRLRLPRHEKERRRYEHPASGFRRSRRSWV